MTPVFPDVLDLCIQVTFFGYKVLHWSAGSLNTSNTYAHQRNCCRYESVAWIPNVITFIVMLGVGGKYLNPSEFPSTPAPTASELISCATLIASSVISWCTLTPDYGVYHDREASRYISCNKKIYFAF